MNFLTKTILNPHLIEFSYPQNPKMWDPILVTLLKMQPHYSQSSRENATPSSGTSPLASYKGFLTNLWGSRQMQAKLLAKFWWTRKLFNAK